ncbi:MAG: hypothetical protein R2813_02030 [Flavobacteriales bacterium]
MKQLFTTLLVLAVITAFTSCKTCGTCTNVSDDPQDSVDVITDEFCGRGREYSDWVTIHERTDWECTEN